MSGLELEVGAPRSEAELYLLETRDTPALTVLNLAAGVATLSGGDPIDFDGLPASDLAAVALTIRQAWVGDRLTTEGTCPSPECGELVDIAFSAETYLGFHRPRTVDSVRPASDPRRFVLADIELGKVEFRIPTVKDLVGAMSGSLGPVQMTETCIETSNTGTVDPMLVQRVDHALESLSPSLQGQIQGACPQCEKDVSLWFDPCTYVLAELRDLFKGIYFEIHLLAQAYGWAESVILDLPRHRRLRYANLVAAQRASA